MLRTRKQLMEAMLDDISKILLGNELNIRYLKFLRGKQPDRRELEGDELRLLSQREELVNQLEILGEMLKDPMEFAVKGKTVKTIEEKQKN